MPLLSWMAMLSIRPAKAKQNIEPPCCPLCHEHWRIVRYGRYWRYGYGSNQRVAVARYACRNPACPRRTFSVLPHGLLPQVRMPLCLLMALYRLHVAQAQPLNPLARMLRHSWTTIRRAVMLARRLLDWCRHEVCAEAMDPWPCHPHRWPAFCRAFSYAFRPGQHAPQSINTIR
jgi:hypothetical protein